MTERAIIAGSLALPDLLTDTSICEVSTPWSEQPVEVMRCTSESRIFYLLNRHGKPRHAPHAIPYKAQMAALRELGVTQVVGISTSGGIAECYQPGCLVLPHQIIDYSWGREHSFHHPHCSFDAHLDFTQPYNIEVRSALLDAASREEIPLIPQGVFACAQGPRLESAAEVDRLERDGCQLVGMTQMPEASLAGEAGIAYACLSPVVNPAAGRGRIDHTDIKEAMNSMQTTLQKLLLRWLHG